MAFLGPSLRRRRESDRPGVRVVWALLLSLLLNAAALWVIVWAGAFGMPDAPEVARPIALAPLGAEQWEANRRIAGEPAPLPPVAVAPPPRPPRPAPPPPPPPKEEERPPGQVVDVAPSGEARRPPESRFLADRDNTVERETRSRHAGKAQHENTLSAPSPGPAGPPAQGEDGTASESRPGQEAPDGPAGTGADRLVIPDQPQEEQLALAPPARGEGEGGLAVAPKTGHPRIRGDGEELELPGSPLPPEGGARKSGRIDPRLLPDVRSLERIAGGPSPDALDGVEEGEGTALNTRSYKYAMYINRVASGIYARWKPARALDARDPDRKMFPNRDWTTVVMVNLDASGQLVSVGIVEQSGLEFLDQEVVRAVRAAAPFPNPPSGLVDPDGRVRLALGWRLLAARPGGLQFIAPRTAPGMQRPYPE